MFQHWFRTAAFIKHDDVPNVELGYIKEMVVCGVDNRSQMPLKIMSIGSR